MTVGGCRGEVWRRRRSQSLRAEAGPGPQLLEIRELLARPLGPPKQTQGCVANRSI